MVVRDIDSSHEFVLSDNSQSTVAIALSKQYLERLSEVPEYKNLVAPLKEARDAVWPEVMGNRETFNRNMLRRQEKFKEILGELKSGEDQQRFIEAFGKIGHLYEVAGQLARDNYFAKQRLNDRPVAHGAEEYIKTSFESPAEAVEKLNKAKFEATFTSHPTNNNSLEIMTAIRELGDAASDLRKDGSDAAREKQRKAFGKAMDKFVKAPLVPEKNFTVAGETTQMLMSAENVYNDLAASYRHFDRALEAKAQESGQKYDPLSLNLDVRLNFWGSSGDKDGNKQVNADTTLQAGYMHTAKIAELLNRDLGKILEGRIGMGPSGNDLVEIGDDLQKKQAELRAINEELSSKYLAHKTGDKLTAVPIPQEEFDKYSAKLAELAPDTKKLEAVLKKAYKEGNYASDNPMGRQLLMLARRAHTFGPHMGKLEYRETSEEFTKIVALVLSKAEPPLEKPYLDMDESERTKLLTDILQSGRAKEVMEKARAEINEKGFGHNYDKDPYPGAKVEDFASAQPIAYHTLKRLELARDNPNLVANHVMAECQGLSNKLELQLLMEGVEKNGKKPALGIIPLYEDPDVMQKVGKIEADSYANPAYMKHMAEFAKAHPDECATPTRDFAQKHPDRVVTADDGTLVKFTQQVQFAHSDNRRRGGPAAAVGFIDQGHRDYRAAAEGNGIEARNYEGGSQSDAFRNGVRSVSAMISEFGLYKFAKMTFQGGDLLNYFGHPHSCERLITRSIVHCAKHYDDLPPLPDLKKEPYNYLGVKALQETLQDYEKNIFKRNKIGLIIANAGFGPDEMNAGNVGTRAQRDPSKVFVTVNDVDVPMRDGNDGKLGFATSKVTLAIPENIRTISFSELLEHAGVYPTWLGTRTLAKNIGENANATLKLLSKQQGQVSKDELELRSLLKRAGDAKEASPELMQALYNKSPAFREVIDRMAFGISMSSLDSLENLNPILKDTPFMKYLKDEYLKAGDTVLSAMGGRHRSNHEAARISGATETAAMRQAVTTALAHLKPNITHKRNYMEFVNYFKRDWIDKHPRDERPVELLRTTHCAMDTALHSRWLTADDPHYGAAISGVELTRSGSVIGASR